MPDRGAAAGSFPSCERGARIVGVARRDAQAGDSDEQPLGDLPRRLAGAGDGVGKPLGNEIAHRVQSARATNQIVSMPKAIIAAAITINTPWSETASKPPAITMARRTVPARTGRSTRPAPCEAK